jgi:hypothetical protein
MISYVYQMVQVTWSAILYHKYNDEVFIYIYDLDKLYHTLIEGESTFFFVCQHL